MNNNHCAKNYRPGLILLWLLIALLIGLHAEPASAAHKHTERWYQEQWCTEGQMEYQLPDHTRVDCLTDTHAVEVDFAKKWYEGYTQARWYAIHTSRRAALLLIIEKETDLVYFHRAQTLATMTADHIDIWIIRSPD